MKTITVPFSPAHRRAHKSSVRGGKPEVRRWDVQNNICRSRSHVRTSIAPNIERRGAGANRWLGVDAAACKGLTLADHAGAIAFSHARANLEDAKRLAAAKALEL